MDRDLKAFLDKKADQFNDMSFIKNDPISVPHQFHLKQDIEIIGLWTAILSWGQRKTIINKANELVQLMDGSPYDFIINHKEEDRKRFLEFKHRTFQSTDTLYFLDFFQNYYHKHDSLEQAFVCAHSEEPVVAGLNQFYQLFFSNPEHPKRTIKHLSCPAKKSTCKRINMFLRWMVRKDAMGVDFGVWNKIRSADLMIPLDVHVGRVARNLGILSRTQNDWKAVIELTTNLRSFDNNDPIKYDFALFGLGISEKDNWS